MSSRSTRNSLLAAAAGLGAVAAVLQVVSTSLSFDDFLSFPTRTSLKVASGLQVLGWAFALAAFGVALAAFLLRSRRTRTKVLAVSAGLFAGYGASTLVSALIDLIQTWGFGEQWRFQVAQCAGAAAGLSLAIAGVLVAIGVLSGRPDGLLGWGSGVLAGNFAMLCVAYSFELAGFLTIPGTLPSRLSWGLGTSAAGHLVLAVAAVVASVTFFVAKGRRGRGELWQAQREGSLGVAACVFVVGFVISGVGLTLFASQGTGRNAAEQWLQAVAQLLLALAAVCGAVGFFSSRRGLGQRDGADPAAFAGPG